MTQENPELVKTYYQLSPYNKEKTLDNLLDTQEKIEDHAKCMDGYLNDVKNSSFSSSFDRAQHHLNLNENYNNLKIENDKLKNKVSNHEFLMMENTQLRKLIDEQVVSDFDLVSARVLIDKKSPYLNSFIINIGKNKSGRNIMKILANLIGSNSLNKNSAGSFICLK